GDLRPLPVSLLLEQIKQGLDFKRLAELLGIEPPTLTADSDFTSLLHWLESVVGAHDEAFDERCDLESPIHEHRLYRLARASAAEPAALVAGMITLLALLVQRFGHPDLRIQPEWAIAQMGADGRLSVDGFLRSVQRRIRGGSISIGDIMQ